MSFLSKQTVAAILASTCLLCAAAPVGLTLSDSLPNHLADALLARVLARAGESGATEIEELGRPFVLLRDGTPLGEIVPGRSIAAGSDGRVKTCFVALVKSGGWSVAIVPAPLQGHPGSAGCHGYTALGVLPSGSGMIRLGILYDMDAPPLTFPVVLAWRDGQPPAVDVADTTACNARHVTTIAEMRRPGCGRPSVFDRAFPLP